MRRITVGRDEDHALQGAVPYKSLIERETPPASGIEVVLIASAYAVG